MRLVDHVQHRTAMTEGADSPLGRRIEGRVDRNVRPRCSAGVIPRGNSGGAPVAANLLSAGEEKKRGSVRWNSAMASSSAAVGSTVFW